MKIKIGGLLVITNGVILSLITNRVILIVGICGCNSFRSVEERLGSSFILLTLSIFI